LPTVLKSVAKIMRELRTAANEIMREITESIDEEEARKKPVVPRPPRTPLVSLPPEDSAEEPPAKT